MQQYGKPYSCCKHYKQTKFLASFCLHIMLANVPLGELSYMANPDSMAEEPDSPLRWEEKSW